MTDPAETPAAVHRLTDIVTEEVSIVDRAANQRTFLVVKGADMKTGQAVVADGKGGHTVVKDTPVAPPPAVPPTAPATGGPSSEPVLRLSPEAKAELVKRFVAAETRLAQLKALVSGATEVAGLVEVPNDIATKVAELLTGLAQGETEKAGVAKGLPQFSTARMGQLQAAYDALGAVIGSVAKPALDPAPDSVAASDAAVADGVAKALVIFEGKLAKGLDAIASVVAKHGEAIEKQSTRVQAVESTRATPRSAAPEGARESVDKSDDEDATDGKGWPTDMADPDRHDVTKVDPAVRFTAPARG